MADANTPGSVPIAPAGRREIVFAWLLIALGVALRLRTYLAARALRRDEAMLALNLVRRSFAGLLGPLDDDQGAPPGFLWLEKLAVVTLGNNEYALRLVPLIAGVVALPVCWLVARRLLGAGGGLLTLGFLATAEPLVFYASETKQYSSDVAVAVGLLAAEGRRKWSVLAMAGSVAVWFSHPALFILGGIGLAGLLFERAPRAVLTAAACWLMSFGAEDRFFLRHLRASEYMRQFWADAFMPLPPRSGADLRWFLTNAFEVFKDPCGLTFDGLAGAVFVLGVLALVGGRKQSLALLATPVLLALVASGLKAYPFSTRLLLFAAPLLQTVIAAGFVSLKRGSGRVAAAVLLGVLLIHPALATARNLWRPLQAEELKRVMSGVALRIQPGDTVYVYFASEPAYRFYSEYADAPVLKGAPVVFGANGRKDRTRYAGDVTRLRGRVWCLISHAPKDDERYVREGFDGVGIERERVEAFGASAFLYEIP